MKYSQAEQAAAVDLYESVGPKEAARQTGISDRTIQRWAAARGLVGDVAANEEKTRAARAAAAERVSQTWADFRESEALGAGALAVALRGELRDRMMNHADGKDLRDLAVTYGILIDKAELLSGQATSRIEVWAESEVDRELRELIGRMEDRVRES